ncbi:putative protein N(5)-glutamine methyltransferase [Nocardioides sp. DS6]|uniref:Methyltransferase small domain-containing protein n=1 Tax=Nocardioides eburneus TaxID=3231482 RepID=A0ABV3STP9_9ACTN
MTSREPAPGRPLVAGGTLVARLRAAGCVFAEEEAALLEAEAGGDAGALEAMVRRRTAGEPLELVLGWAELCGVRVRVTPGVFVPRRRSALLARLAVAETPRLVVDLGCGTGALGAVVAAHAPGAQVWAVDVDPAAVACARRNLAPERVLLGDLYTPLPTHLRGQVDVLLVNAPYVPSDAVALMPPEARDHEHLVALDGGPDGLDVQRRVVADASSWLRPGGVLLLETSRAQASGTAALMRAAGLVPTVHEDDDIDGTAVAGCLRADKDEGRPPPTGGRPSHG